MTRPRQQRITSVLVANRGEIAVRVIRTCREMGIRPIAVYTNADRGALHVQEADASYQVDNYLNVRGVTGAAKEAKADAIHPGYGFLAENAQFAAACARAGLIFIGPPASVIHTMGSKIAARQVAARAGIPVVPGTVAPLRNLGEGRRSAAKIGYPILLKAVAGGGGKGMRTVASSKDLAASYRLAEAEAKAAFGDSRLYVEKLLQRPHHIEVQILADHQGNVIHCFERECSVQRRHQKVIEETPSPFLKPATRQALCEAAIRFARAGKYRNAGTVEFLVEDNQPDRFYFLEMNTRIQVEHPITELVTGLDLVKTQILIAMGEPLPWRQEEISSRGHAIECRLYAENPFADFLPAPGRITTLAEPHGPGVRIDTGVVAGSTVPVDYDPILGKLSVWANTRPDAIARMQRALREYRIGGIVTNLAFHDRVLGHAAFRAGHYDTQFVPIHLKVLTAISTQELEQAMCVAAIVAGRREQQIPQVPTLPAPSSWGMAARQETLREGMDRRTGW